MWARCRRDVIGTERAEALAEQTAAALLRMQRAILAALDGADLRLNELDRSNIGGLERVAFTVNATRLTHALLLRTLRGSDATDQVEVFVGDQEE